MSYRVWRAVRSTLRELSDHIAARDVPRAAVAAAVVEILVGQSHAKRMVAKAVRVGVLRALAAQGAALPSVVAGTREEVTP